MAGKKKIYGIAERDWPDVRKLLDEFRKVGRTLRHPKTAEERRATRPSTDQAAIANGSIAPGATVSVFLADDSFAATADTKDATNDSDVTIPDGTKLIIGKVKPLSGLRIKQAFICTD